MIVQVKKMMIEPQELLVEVATYRTRILLLPPEIMCLS